jgi:vacuolar-type H+-ATPase subunit C/Vma6
MRTFFARIIDSRNLMSMYKYLRLAQTALPPFIPGGNISETRLREAIAKENFFGISTLVREFFGIRIDAPDPTKVEIALYKAITQFLKKEGREPFGIAPMLDYLWRCSLEVMNLSILYSGKGLERDLVTAELVQ